MHTGAFDDHGDLEEIVSVHNSPAIKVVHTREHRRALVGELLDPPQGARRPALLIRAGHVKNVLVPDAIRLAVPPVASDPGTSRHAGRKPMTTAIDTEWRSDLDASDRVSDELVQSFRDNGFVRIRGVFGSDELAHFADAARAYLEAHRAESRERVSAEYAAIFTQLVNVWRHDEGVRGLTLHPRVAGLAQQLTGRPMRIWHDHMLVKEPHSNAATQFHQDRPYWPHDPSSGVSLSAWIALVDVPPERGCMTFLPGTQRLTGFRPQNLHDEEDLFRVDPDLRWSQRVTVPLRAGDLTFHSSYTGHMALPNTTDEARLAHVNIYMDADTTYIDQPHVVTDGQGLATGDRLDSELFPRPLD